MIKISDLARSKTVFKFLLFVVGILIFLIYALTLSYAPFPGSSSALTVRVAGLVSDRLPAHGLWFIINHVIAKIPWVPLSISLNLFNALIATLALILFSFLTERWLLRNIRLAGEGESFANFDDQDELQDNKNNNYIDKLKTANVPLDSVEIGYHAAARVGSIVALLALAFCRPFWAVANSLNLQTLDYLLLISMMLSATMHAETFKLRWAIIASFIGGFGCIESHLFVIIFPAVYLVMLRNQFRADLPWERYLGITAGIAVVGILTGFVILTFSARISLPEDTPLHLRSIFSLWMRSHLSSLISMLPPYGWVWLILLSILPFLIMLFAVERLFVDCAKSASSLCVIISLALLLPILNFPKFMFENWNADNYIYTLSAFATAFAAGMMVAYWHIRREMISLWQQGATDEQELYGWQIKGLLTIRTIFIALFVVAVFTAAILNRNPSNGNQAKFVNEIATDILKQYKPDSWLINNSDILANHLMILAKERNINLKLIDLKLDQSKQRKKKLLNVINADEKYSNTTKIRLGNVLEIGPLALARELMINDKGAPSNILVVGAPELWSMAGFRPLPHGFAYGGIKTDSETVTYDLHTSYNKAAFQHYAQILKPDIKNNLPRSTEQFRAILRREAGRAANMSGVLLEDCKQMETAFQTYEIALLVDPLNISAMLNMFTLISKGMHPQFKATLENMLRQRAVLDKHPPSDYMIVSTYGDIRDPRVYARFSQKLSVAGQPELARQGMDQALLLDPENSLLKFQLASLTMAHGDMAKSKQEFQEMLATNPTNSIALAGMAIAAAMEGNLVEARMWLVQAKAASAPQKLLDIPEIAVAAASEDLEQTIGELRTMLDRRDSDNIVILAVMADMLLRYKQDVAIPEIEKVILPAMAKSSGNHDHIMIHLTQAAIYCTKKPADYKAARNSLLRVLELRPGLLPAQNQLLQIDFKYGNSAILESDALRVLRNSPENPLANYMLGTIKLERGDLERAEDLFRHSLTNQPSMQAFNDLAETLRQQKRLEEAEQTVRQALNINDTLYVPWDTLACILCDRNILEQAEQAALHAIGLYPDDPQLTITLAKIYLKQKRIGAIRSLFSQPLMQVSSLPPEIIAERDKLLEQCNH